MRLRVWGAALLALVSAACAAVERPLAPSRPPPEGSSGTPPSSPSASVARLPGWNDEDHASAYAAFVSGCGVAADPAMVEVCRRARAAPNLDRRGARRFFETNFHARRIEGEGVLTAYFVPEYPARDRPGGDFTGPVRGKPADLVMVDGGVFDRARAGRPVAARRGGGRLQPYPDRSEIEASPVARPLAWMRPEELFLLQVQGSGVLDFPDGRRIRAAVAATNGRTFVAIANPMRERGLLAPDATGADTIRQWLAANRGPAADAIMRLNPRYVFFTLAPYDGSPPLGAAKVGLPAGHAVAVDPGAHQMGELLWVDASRPSLAGAKPVYQRLALALDVGGAIKGAVRSDLYLGQGDAAGAEAGRVRHVLRLYRLVPDTRPFAP
ncbi:MltA domain-containing protein [Phenylobacterium sp.]|jgi:membrane-bound lytic murein transglycosylase A|uniref:MltA domain-containing protein n=1 Tax=Phenylobacterium sp. TaxID=1871053 RepID=UPI002F3FBE04